VVGVPSCDRSQAILLCEDVAHEVIPGGSIGILDGIAVAKGLIRLVRKHSPATSR
jgi:hypothetical protein